MQLHDLVPAAGNSQKRSFPATAFRPCLLLSGPISVPSRSH